MFSQLKQQSRCPFYSVSIIKLLWISKIVYCTHDDTLILRLQIRSHLLKSLCACLPSSCYIAVIYKQSSTCRTVLNCCKFGLFIFYVLFRSFVEKKWIHLFFFFSPIIVIKKRVTREQSQTTERTNCSLFFEQKKTCALKNKILNFSLLSWSVFGKHFFLDYNVCHLIGSLWANIKVITITNWFN